MSGRRLSAEQISAKEVAEDIAKAFDGSWPLGRTVYHIDFRHKAKVKELIHVTDVANGTRSLGYVRVEYSESQKQRGGGWEIALVQATWKWDDCGVVD